MALDRRTSTPLYVQLKDAVVSEIRAGDLQPGDRVGSESELERRHGVSRITVRQALKTLVQEGALYRVPGKGTYVASPKVAPLAAFTSFSENMRSQGLTPSYRLLSARLISPPAVVRQELRLGEHDRAWRIERLLLANGEPMGLQDGFYPARLFGGEHGQIDPESLAAGSLYAQMERTLDFPLGNAEETLEPAIANRKEVELLRMPDGAPVLVVRRLSYLVGGEPIERVKLVFRGDMYRYRVDLNRGQRSDE
ncbi:MAG: GntR family transcriptional regulator [Chloroflexota bacterium]|nr:GntR family transcriptional regulator [Chloroflexota bacterium]